ncbi:MAG: folate-binding protein [Acidimicrobiia bacterium]
MIEPGEATTSDLGVEVAAHYGDPTAEWEALEAGAGVVDRSDAGSALVSGGDTFSFLDSLVSADVADLEDGAGVHGLLLSPKGKLVADFRLLRVGDTAWIDTEPGVAPDLVAALDRYRIRVDVEISERSDEFGVLQLRGPAVDDVLAGAGASRPPTGAHAHVAWGEVRIARVARPDDAGVDVVGPLAALTAAWADLTAAGAVRVGRSASEAHRIAAGIPRQGHDIDERTIPQEAGLELDAVSFTKGCFLGQELVCRIDSRGRVNRFLRRLTPDGPAPAVGAEILDHDGERAGEVTSVSAAPVGPVALGYTHRRVEPPGPVQITVAPAAETAGHVAAGDGDVVVARVAALPGMVQGGS